MPKKKPLPKSQVWPSKAHEYAEKVLAGKIPAGKKMIQCCDRFQKDLKRKDLVFDFEDAERVLSFFETILVVPELGKCVEVPLPHAFWLQQLFGFKIKETGLRRFNSMYLQVARKNFKTFYAAGVSLYQLIIDSDRFPFIMQGANSRDQALICTDMTGKIVKASPDLRELLDIEEINIYTYRQKTTEIVYQTQDRDGRIEAMPRDPGDGGNPSIGIVDEYHEAEDDRLLNTIESGQGARMQPVTIIITSPGYNKEGPCFSVLRKKGIDILDDVIEDDNHLTLIFELDDEEDWDKVEELEKSNPMIPYSATLKPYLTRRINKAKTEGGTTEVNVKIKNCGIWVDAPDVWISDKVWMESSEPIIKVADLGLTWYGGLDLASTKDFNAFSLVSEPDAEGFHNMLFWFWIPKEGLFNRMHRDKNINYQRWMNEGVLNVTEGNTADFRVIGDKIRQIHAKYDIKTIGFDPYLSGELVADLADEGISMTEVIQKTSNLSPATKYFEKMAFDRKLRHGGNEIMRWMMRNVVLWQDGNENIRISKKSSIEKVDGPASSVNAFAVGIASKWANKSGGIKVAYI